MKRKYITCAGVSAASAAAMVVLYKKIKNTLSEQPVSNMLSRKEESKPL